MVRYEGTGYQHSVTIGLVVDKIVKMCQPEKIILYNQKLNVKGHTTSFKLCVVVNSKEPDLLARDIYIEIDCDIPFDVLVYSSRQWKTLLGQPDTFAGKIEQMGIVIYGS